MMTATFVAPAVSAAALRPVRIERVEALSFPYDYCHDRYQAYYASGLREAVEAAGGRFTQSSPSVWPGALVRLRRARHSWRMRHLTAGPVGRMMDRAGEALSRCRRTPSAIYHPLVGQYVFGLSDGRACRVCIDSQDAGDIASPDLLDWCDLYFKTNYWAGHDYGEKVRPMFNGNPLLLGKLAELRALRNRPADYDVCFFVRVWGGADEVGGIEHILRLLEAVNRVDCRKLLLAYLVAGDKPAIARRLEGQGIRWCTKPMALAELWRVTARSRVNVIRLGMHDCVPWRMADLLALGACPVLDQPPRTIWPDPLIEGTHYAGLDAVTHHSQAVADDYDRVPDRLSSLLADHAAIDRIRGAAADYFDDHLDPIRLGERVCRAVTAG